MASDSLVEIAKRGRLTLAKWRRVNPEALLNLSDADLKDADLRGANLKRADLTGADLRGANLVGAQLAEADLTRADLRGAKLQKADLYSARLFKASLVEALCSGAYFRRADLTQVDFSDADLVKADLIDVQLKNATLARASLVGADLSRSNLTGVDLREAVIGWTVLGALDLTQVVGLEQVRHVGPSTLGFDTARLSHSKLPVSFLHGCGISESVVQSWATLFDHPLETFPCLIRFAPDDRSFAQTVFERGQSKGLRCWLDELPAAATDRRQRNSPTSYESNERVLLCLSKASLSSWWIADEIDRILAREALIKQQTGKEVRLLFPLSLDSFLFSGDFKHPQEKRIAKALTDFVGWRRNQEKFDQEFSKLIQTMTK